MRFSQLMWNGFFYITEIMNLRNLERVLAREEEVKKRAVVHKAVYSGPQTRYLSINGKHFLFNCQYLLFSGLTFSVTSI